MTLDRLIPKDWATPNQNVGGAQESAPAAGRLLLSGLVTGRDGNLITQESPAVRPWTAAVAKAVTAPLLVRAVVEKAALAWRGDLFLGVAVPVIFPRTNGYGLVYEDPVFLYPLVPEMDVSGYFEGLNYLIRGDGGHAGVRFREFARAVQPFKPSREEAEAVMAAIADVADHIKGMLGGRRDASVDVFGLRSLMLGACTGGTR